MVTHRLSRSCESLGGILPLEVKTGRFVTPSTLIRQRGQHHSWLELSSEWLVDVYPVYALMGPFFVWVHEDSPWAGMYIEYMDEQLQKVIDDPCTQKSINVISKVIEQQLGMRRN